MSRQLIRSACRAFTECQASVRSVANNANHSAGLALRSASGKAQTVAPFAGLAACPVLRSFRQGITQVPAVPVGFAASALSTPGLLSVLGSTAQHRGLSSADGSEEGDGDDSDPTYIEPVAGSQTSITPINSDDDPPDLSLGEPGEGQGGRRRPGQGPRGGPQGGADEVLSEAALRELQVSSRDLFMRQPDLPRGTLPSLPREVREAMHSHRWDRVLVDVRRTVERKTRGKHEVYSAMVATGNMAGVFGLGMGLAETAQLAVARAHLDSFSRLVAVPLYRGHTIYHAVDHTYHTTKIRMMPRPEGWGLRCSDLLYELCSLAGIKNISVVLLRRSKNKYFMAQCFLEALLKQTTPHDGVEATGMYIREVYYKKDLPYGLKRGVDVM